jgi:poly(3-hydroxybutyrate) depolymerase
MKRLRRSVAMTLLIAGFGNAAAAQELMQLGSGSCPAPSILHCPDDACPAPVVVNQGTEVEMKSRRTYFLDYPCDLKRGEKVTFILSLHGGGSYGNWQRHYFPLLDYTDKYRLIVATPFSPRRVWSAEDDGYLQNIVSSVIDAIGRENIKAFWLAGHSQGGLTSSRIICSDFFATKVDGFLSLSGGRVGGQAGRASNFGIPAQTGAATGRATPRGGPPAGALAIPPPPMCDFSHIFATGEHEISELPKTSARAQKYQCSADTKRREVTDSKAGYVFDGSRQNPGSKGWGLRPRPGKADIFTFHGCKDRRVVADVVRIDKGHTEGLEPKVTEEIVKLMLSARGGKIQHGG